MPDCSIVPTRELLRSNYRKPPKKKLLPDRTVIHIINGYYIRDSILMDFNVSNGSHEKHTLLLPFYDPSMRASMESFISPKWIPGFAFFFFFQPKRVLLFVISACFFRRAMQFATRCSSVVNHGLSIFHPCRPLLIIFFVHGSRRQK